MGRLRILDNRALLIDDKGTEYEIKHSGNLGVDLISKQTVTELEPNKYYIFGDVEVSLRITRLLSFNPNILESYKGEFSIHEGGNVIFPSNIRWEKKPNFVPGYTYQFNIENGIGTFIKVKNE